MTSSFRLILAALFVSLIPCSLAAAESPATFKVSELTFQRPEKWEWIPSTSPMRKAQLRIPNASSDPGEVVFFHFGPSNGGGTQANIDRWFRQFREGREAIKARTEEAKAGDSKVTYVFAEGTYMSGMPGTQQVPMPGYGLVGAIIEDPAGHVFVRMTGPKELTAAVTDAFKAMVSGAMR
jgi:hypothetical protein